MRLFFGYGLILFFFSIQNLAFGMTATEEEQFLREDIELSCGEEIHLDCEGLYNCLTRRDSCVKEGRARNKEKCQKYNRCNQKNHGTLGGTSCSYKWIDHKSVSFCDVSSPGWSRSYHCPGNYDNFANDNSFFNCTGAKDQYLNTRELCSGKKKELTKKFPGKRSSTFIAKYKIAKCQYFNNFSRHATGEYSIFNRSSSKKNVLGQGREGGKKLDLLFYDPEGSLSVPKKVK